MTNFEFKLYTPDAKKVDVSKTGAEISKDLADFKAKVEEQLSKMKDKIKNSKTWDEVKNFFDTVPLYADPGSLTLTIGDTRIQTRDIDEFNECKQTLEKSLGEANEETKQHREKLQAETEDVTRTTREETDAVKEEVVKEKSKNKEESSTVVTEKTKVKYKEKTTGRGKSAGAAETAEAGELIDMPEFDNLSLLERYYLEHTGGHKDTFTTREENKLARKSARYETATSDKARARLARKIDKTATKIANRRHEANFHMTNAAEKYVHAEELQNQSWYYNDVIQALTKDPRSSRLHYFDEHILIDTYHPLFTNTANFRGTIRLSRASIGALEHAENGRVYSVEEQRWIAAHPEDRETINKGGLAGLLADGLVKYTNFPPESAPAVRSAAKIGALIGLGILGWKTIKKVFNIGGKNEKGDGLKWGLGAAAVLIGVPAITGQSITELLFSGDAKKGRQKTKDLFHLNGLTRGIENLFGDVNKNAVYPALGNLQFSDMTVDEFNKYTVVDKTTGKRKLKIKEFKQYKTEQLTKETDESKKEIYRNQIALTDAAEKAKQADDVVDAYGKKINAESGDGTVSCGERYANYLKAQEAAAEIIEGDKKFKIVDQKKFDNYLVEQTIKYGKKPSEIKIEDLVGTGAVVYIGNEAAPTSGATTKVETSTPTAAEVPNAAPDKETFADKTEALWESTKKEAHEKRNWLKTKVGEISTSIATTTETYYKKLFNITPDSKEVIDYKQQVAAEKMKLNDLKKQLDQLEKLDKTKRDAIATELEIGELKVLIEESDLKIQEIEGLINNTIDREFTEGNLKWIPEAQQKELTRANKKVNFELKFKTANDRARFQTYNPDTQGEKTRLFLESWSEKTNIRFDNGKYYLDRFMVPFDDAESVVRMANLTNFIKINFANRATTNVETPWYIANDGDMDFDSQSFMDAFKKADVRGMLNVDVVDGADRYKSAFKKIGGEVFESRKAEYAQYLNTIMNDRNESLWIKKADTGMIPEELKTIEAKFSPLLHTIQKGKMYTPESPDDFIGKKGILDPNARLESKGGYLFLKSHEQTINIIPSFKKGLYQIGFVNGDKKDGRFIGNFLPLDFKPEEAIKMANLVNYYSQIYRGFGTSNKSFNISTFGRDLEFAEDGVTDMIDIDALPNKVAAEQYAKTFENDTSMEIFKNWLNKMSIWEAK